MKKFKIDLFILLLIALCSTSAVFGQQESDKKSEKEVFITTTVDENGKAVTKKVVRTNGKEEVYIINEDEGDNVEVFIEKNKGDGKNQTITVTTTVDDDGNVTTKKVIKSGGKEKVFITKSSDKDALHEHKDVDVNIDGHGSVKKRVKIVIADDDGKEMETIQWDGVGDMPDALRKRLKENGTRMEMDGDYNVFHIDTDDAPNNACLGVMIGEEKTVENINGVKTTTTEGTSDLGVPILNVIESSGAEAAGLKQDDIITAINGATVSKMGDILSILSPLDAGVTVTVNYLRDGQPAQANATLQACGNNNAVETEEEIEWTDEEGNSQNLNGNKWMFIDEEGTVTTGKEKRKVIIKKNKDDVNELVEVVDGREEFPSSTENLRSLDLETIDIFPNPTDGKLTLKFSAPAQPTKVKIVDVTGKEIYSETLNAFDGNYNKEIDLNNASTGTLILSVHQGNSVFSDKIILQK